jgi:hypothetical protein
MIIETSEVKKNIGIHIAVNNPTNTKPSKIILSQKIQKLQDHLKKLNTLTP